MACDPNALIEQAKCHYACIPPGMMPPVHLSLLCSIVGGGGLNNFPAALLPFLIHYWSMDEASGNRLDSIGGTTLGENGGAVASGPGKRGNAASFSRVTDTYLTSLANATMLEPYSVAFWINMTTDVLAFTGIFHNQTADTCRIWIGVGPQTLLEEAGGGPSTPIVNLGALGTWHLCVYVAPAAGGTVKVSIDGGAFSVGAATTGVGNSVGLIDIGSVGFETINGLMDSVMMFNKELSQADVALLWNGGAGAFL
jgi:hypothetical protein